MCFWIPFYENRQDFERRGTETTNATRVWLFLTADAVVLSVTVSTQVDSLQYRKWAKCDGKGFLWPTDSPNSVLSHGLSQVQYHNSVKQKWVNISEITFFIQRWKLLEKSAIPSKHDPFTNDQCAGIIVPYNGQMQLNKSLNKNILYQSQNPLPEGAWPCSLTKVGSLGVTRVASRATGKQICDNPINGLEIQKGNILPVVEIAGAYM